VSLMSEEVDEQHERRRASAARSAACGEEP
jgi:hypothetical protein